MTTYNQRRRKIHKRPKNFVASPALCGCPQRRGHVEYLVTRSPRKPNSARRKAAKLRLTTGKYVIARIMGIGYHPGKNAIVLIRGKGAKDTPNAKYSIIRGALECTPIFNRRNRRSIYGIEKEKSK